MEPTCAPTLEVSDASDPSWDERDAAEPLTGRVGRYTVLRQVGRGGMGDVYEAFDPELGRKVALKLVRPRNDGCAPESAERLRREAQSLARLSHPNVVPVYDVGVHGDQLFLAMEFVEGTNLRAWHAAAPRTWQETLAVLIQAGRGLAAAHRAGVVHRDVKPANVMVGLDRVLVLDFGLARDLEVPTASLQTPGSFESSRSGDASGLTQAGVLLGTPTFMAPEQFRNQSVDERTDQFAFCVSAWRLLFGEQPFPGEGLRELRRSVLKGVIAPPPKRTGIPRRVASVLRRGMAGDRERRYPTMEPLLTDLEACLHSRRGWWLVGGVAAVALAGTVASTAPRNDAGACEGLDAHVDAVWSAKRRATVRGAFEASAKPYAADTWLNVNERMTAYVASLKERGSVACEPASRADGVDPRVACLRRRLQTADALVALLADADAETMEHASRSVERLPSVADCADLDAPSVDPRIADRVREVERELDEVEASSLAARFQTARGPARSARDRAEELGHPPTLARAERLLGQIEQHNGDFEASKRAYEAAIQASAAAGDARGEALAELDLMWLLSSDHLDLDAVLRHGRNVEALLARLDDPAALHARVVALVGSAHLHAGDLDAAEAKFRLVLEWPGGAEGLPAVRDGARSSLSVVLARRGKYDDSNALIDIQLESVTARRGSSHPSVANALKNKGANLLHLGRHEGALEVLERSAAIYRAAVGDKNAQLATVLHNIGLAHDAAGESDKAFATLRAALKMKKETIGDHPGTAMVASDYGTLLFMHGRREEAVAPLEEAVRMFAATQGTASPGMAYPISTLMQAYTALDRPADALPHTEMALELAQQDVAPALQGSLRYAVARVLYASGKDKARGIELAYQAREDLRSSERPTEDHIEAVSDWIAEVEGKPT